MEYVRICVHQCWGEVFVIGQSSNKQDGLVILHKSNDRYEATQVAKALAEDFNCKYGCEHPYVLEENENTL